MKYEYGKTFHGYEYYTQNIEKLLNNFCKKYGYEFSISTVYGREIRYSILDGSIVITHIKYNYEWHRWMIYQFDFHIDLDNIMKEKAGEDINNKIRRITLSIERLSNESKQALAKELLNMLEQYQKDRSLLRKDGLVLETEEMIKKRFMVSLIDFEEKVNSELAKDEKIREFNDSVMQLEKMANPKKRVKTKKGESSY